jgi:hypothetical protein
MHVAIYVNLLLELDPPALQIPKLRISTLWIMGAVTPNQSRWAMWGDFLHRENLSLVEFDFPTGE